ncbi:MAG: hypothetical protein WCA85_35010 [Paraburkholderia sp.]|uniref:hypothetical protein n=1 Tax=Paraburkholderia sp. TaxID=1926495 RepID=UPI003C4ACDE7
MTNVPPRSIVVTYDEDRQQLILQSVDPARRASLIAGAAEMPILLDEFDFRLDDEFARRFGCSVLSLIALGQPELKQYLTAAQYPLDKPSEEE